MKKKLNKYKNNVNQSYRTNTGRKTIGTIEIDRGRQYFYGNEKKISVPENYFKKF